MRRRPLEFEVGDHVFLKVMPKRGVVRFGKRGKLSPRFSGPFEILERIGTVAYRLVLPPSMSGVHEVIHVSMLRKYTPDPAHVVDWGLMSAKLIYVLSPFHMLFCAFNIHIHVILIKFSLNLVL